VVTPDRRFSVPLYTIQELAYYLRLSESTVGLWVRGSAATDSLVSFIPSPKPKEAEIPFIGFVETVMLQELRHRTSMQKIRKGLAKIAVKEGLHHALASKRLYTDGVELFYNYAEKEDDPEYRELAEVLSDNYVFELALGRVKLLSYEDDGYAGQVIWPLTRRITLRPIIEVRPGRAFGQPTFIRGGSRLKDVLSRFNAGDDPDKVAEDFGVPWDDMLDTLRALTAPPEAA
jgi:uncharacterized protein (DUF433 family)